MSLIKHLIVPLKGTQFIQFGMTIEEVVNGIGPYDRKTDDSASKYDPHFGYKWKAQDVQVRTDSKTRRVKSIRFWKGANLYLGDIPVFESPNLVVLFGMHDPHPIDAGACALYPKLGVQVDCPPYRYGYEPIDGSDLQWYVILHSEEQVNEHLQLNPPRPAYDWKEWLKPNLKDKYGPAEE